MGHVCPKSTKNTTKILKHYKLKKTAFVMFELAQSEPRINFQETGTFDG